MLKYNRTGHRSNKSKLRGMDTMPNNYDEAHSHQEQLSVLQEPDMDYKTKCHFVNITSASRAVSQPLHYNYYIKLEEKYENVVKVEMISAIFPNTTNILNEPFLVFDIKELNCIDFVNGAANHNGFAVLPLKPAAGLFISPEFGTMFHTTFYPKPAITLDRLTVKIRDSTGALYDFAVPAGSTVATDQHSFMLKIVTEEVNTDVLQPRHSYRN